MTAGKLKRGAQAPPATAPGLVVTDTDCHGTVPIRSRDTRRPSGYDGTRPWLDAQRYGEILRPVWRRDSVRRADCSPAAHLQCGPRHGGDVLRLVCRAVAGEALPASRVLSTLPPPGVPRSTARPCVLLRPLRVAGGKCEASGADCRTAREGLRRLRACVHREAR
jgi:hypothetical protein